MPISILFVGNSYTFARVNPVTHYNAANITDLANTALFPAFEPLVLGFPRRRPAQSI